VVSEAELNALSKRVLDAAFAVHTALGPGLLESTYTACLKYELEKPGLEVRAEVPVPIVYDGHKLMDVGYRIDLLVNGELVIEVKALEAIAPVHHAQLLSYLKHSKRRLGLLLNFNVEHMRDGITRKVSRL
jgi:GxxExxY protein